MPEELTYSIEHVAGGMFRLAVRKPNGENVISIEMPVIQLAQLGAEISSKLTSFLQACAAQVPPQK